MLAADKVKHERRPQEFSPSSLPALYLLRHLPGDGIRGSHLQHAVALEKNKGALWGGGAKGREQVGTEHSDTSSPPTIFSHRCFATVEFALR